MRAREREGVIERHPMALPSMGARWHGARGAETAVISQCMDVGEIERERETERGSGEERGRESNSEEGERAREVESDRG